MTVCIAAVCDDGARCVVAADRQMTVGTAVQFEHNERKIDALVDSFVVLSAGQALVATETIRRTIGRIAGSLDFAQASAALRDEYMAVHLERVEEVIFRPRGWTLEEFKRTGAQQIPLQVYLQMDQQVFNFSLNTEFILAGVDNGGAHIGWIHYHGVAGGGWLEVFDKIGYHAIGSGGQHALISLHFAGQHRAVSSTRSLFNVFRAKKIAEIAPGVGPQTDLAIIDGTGTRFLGQDVVETLNEMVSQLDNRAVSDDDLERVEGLLRGAVA